MPPSERVLKMFGFLTLFLLFQQSSCLDENLTLCREVFNYHKETANKALFAKEVVEIMLSSFNQKYFTIAFCDFTYFENRILKFTENYGYGKNIMLLNSCSYFNKSIVKPMYNKHGDTTYLVTSDNLSAEMSDTVIDAFKRTGVFKPRSAVIFVITTPMRSNNYLHDTLHKHFQSLWSSSITNSVLIVKTDSLRMYSYNPFLQEVRDITGAQHVAHLLQKQYQNLYDYKLRLSVFRKVFLTNKTGPVLCDSNLVKTVMNYINASCVPLPPRDDSTVGDLLENGTATGVTADLMDSYSDLELNSRILKNTYYGYIDTTYPFIQDELCFFIKQSGTRSAFNTIIQLISENLLLLFMATFLIFIIITISAWKIEMMTFTYRERHSIGETIMNLIKCFLRQTVNIVFNGPIFRFLVVLIIVYSLIVDCIIDGIITTAVTYPHYKPDINTLDELGKSNLIIGIHNRDIGIANKSFSPDFYGRIKNRIELINDHKIKEVLDTRNFKYALLLRKSDALRIYKKLSSMEKGKPLFYVMPDCPLPCFIVFGLRYGSPYLPRINFILQQLNQGGILQYWSRLEENTESHKLLKPGTKEKKALSIISLQEMFYVLLIGEAISTFIFILELLFHKFTSNK